MLAGLRKLEDILQRGSLCGKRVIVRADLNIPVMTSGGQTARDTSRLAQLRPSLLALREAGARVAILSHFGRPKGRGKDLSLAPVAALLGEILQLDISFAPDCIGAAAEEKIAALEEGGIVVLENTRFHQGEKANDKGFARALAALGDIFVNDAFSVSHRNHASTEGITHYLPSCAGFALDGELAILHRLLDDPEKPVMALCGGAKIGSKLPLLRHLTRRVDILALAGGIAHVFIAARGQEIGQSLCEHDLIGEARALMEETAKSGCVLLLPQDVRDNRGASYPAAAIPSHCAARDIGEKAAAAFCEAMDKAQTLIWNGPLGAFEMPPSDEGTKRVARHAAARARAVRLKAIAGGGETAAALNSAGVYGDFTHVSTGGGAFLRWLQDEHMPVLDALRRKHGGDEEEAAANALARA